MNNIILTLDSLQAWLLSLDTILEFDVETTGLSSSDTLTSIQLGNGESEIFIPLDQKGTLTAQEVIPIIKTNFEDSKLLKVAHNIKFDARVLKRYGITVSLPYFDTMIATALVYPDLRRKPGRGWKDKFALKALVEHFFDIETPNWKQFLEQNKIEYEVEGKIKKNGKKSKSRIKKRTPESLAELSLEKQAVYALNDIIYTRKLRGIIEPQMNAQTRWIFENIEMPVLPVLLEMEHKGILLDINMVREYTHKYSTEMEKAKKEVFRLAKKEFDINSHPELVQVLYYEMKVPLYRLTPKGEISVDQFALEPLAEKYPICKYLLDYRKYSKLLSTYCQPYPNLLCKDGRLHSEFGITATGRLTSSNPNLQNIPARDDESSEVRNFFVAPDNHKLLCCDYSQMEIVMVAEQSRDARLIHDIKHKVDIHTQTAVMLWGDFEKRKDGKTTNFALLFGQTPVTLAGVLKIPIWESRKKYDKFFNRYPDVLNWFTGIKEESHLSGVVSTLLGRTRNLIAAEPDPRIRANLALNTPIQASCADLVKIAMIRCDKVLKEMGFRTKLVLQVHDELLFEVPDDEIETIKPYIIGCMESVIIAKDYVMSVPMRVELEVKQRWNEEVK